MKVAGIIAEYNPFHNGHKYQIDKIKSAGFDYCIAVMSGQFTERGLPAIADKHTRALMALKGGIDLVIELPVYLATGRADRFAFGGVKLMDSLNVVDSLCFGIEPESKPYFSSIANFLLNPPKWYDEKLASYMKDGKTYPESRVCTLSEYFDCDTLSCLNGSNTILGLEYISAMHKISSSMKPFIIDRVGSKYNDTECRTDGFSSAGAIRLALNSNHDSLAIDSCPEYSVKLLNSLNLKNVNDYSDILHYKLTTATDYCDYLDVGEDISNRIRSLLPEYKDYESFISLVKTKNITYNSVARNLLHILLNIPKDVTNHANYARILGFRKESSELIRMINDKSSIPVINKLADAKITEELKLDIMASSIYDRSINEYKKTPVII